jgi:CRISPR-associated protein Cas5d
VIDKVRIIKPIRTEAKNVKPLIFDGGNSIATYTYLSNVEYQILAHFEWNLQREDLAHDRNDGKHFSVAQRMLDRGGRRDIFLGTRECQAYVEPCKFHEGIGYYDDAGELSFGFMFHGFDYPDTTGKSELVSRFWRPTMFNGVIEFQRPECCTVRKYVRKMNAESPATVGLLEEGLFS